MPKHLLLCRHADTLPAMSGNKDFDRILSRNGQNEAFEAATWIKSLGLSIDAIYFSAAVRTTQTAQLVAADLGVNPDKLFSEEILYNAPAISWLQHVETLDPALNTIILIGHNPGVSDFASNLTNGKTNNMRTGSVVFFLFDTEDWQEVENANLKFQMKN